MVGQDRLPNIEDRDSLPYLNLIIAEVLRYNPIAPIVPHSLDEDDIYEGYLIPKGSWVMVNVWWVSALVLPSYLGVLTHVSGRFYMILIPTITRRSSSQSVTKESRDTQPNLIRLLSALASVVGKNDLFVDLPTTRLTKAVITALARGYTSPCLHCSITLHICSLHSILSRSRMRLGSSKFHRLSLMQDIFGELFFHSSQ